jgi:hypothetical protein
MSLSRPTATLQLGDAAPFGGPLDAAQAALLRLTVELSVGEAHDRVELMLWQGSLLASASPGAELVVGLGEADGPEDVLTVEVAGCDATAWGAVLTGYAPSRRLSSTYVGRAYVDSTVADVVSDLLGEAGVQEGTVDSGLSLPAFHVDPHRSVWATLHELARLSGSQVTTGADGAVSFTPIPGASAGGGLASAATSAATSVAAAVGLGSSDELREGAELLTFRIGPRQPIAAVGVQTPVAATAGLLLAEPDSGAGHPVDVLPSARTPELADAARAAREAASRRRTRTARVTVPGRPGLRAGATVKARGESYRVLQVRHVLDTGTGYRCDLLLEGDQ